MKQQLFLLLCSALLYIPAGAQNGWLPPVTFPSNTGMCDDASWKLVLYDDFNGNALDTNTWIRYTA